VSPGEDVVGGRASPVAGEGRRENFHCSAQALPATRRHARRLIRVATSQVKASFHDFAVSLFRTGGITVSGRPNTPEKLIPTRRPRRNQPVDCGSEKHFLALST
jgi:hypothetical protein